MCTLSSVGPFSYFSMTVIVLYYHAYYLTISGLGNRFNSNLCIAKIAMLCFLWGYSIKFKNEEQ